MSNPPADLATHAYRRQARRLRARLADEPGELYRSLRHLSDRHDAERAAEASAPLFISDGPSGRFAAHVALRVDAQVLRYSERRKLIRAAERLGIGRFQANLIIAAVQHEQAESHGTIHQPPARPLFRFAPLVACLIIQTFIAAMVWGIFLR